MVVSENAYISEILQRKKNKIIERIRRQKNIPFLYCVTLPLWKSAVLEIFEYNELLSDFYQNQEIVIVGLAAGKDDALVITKRIVKDLVCADQITEAVHYFCGEEA